MSLAWSLLPAMEAAQQAQRRAIGDRIDAQIAAYAARALAAEQARKACPPHRWITPAILRRWRERTTRPQS